jgi:hypothetical protein
MSFQRRAPQTPQPSWHLPPRERHDDALLAGRRAVEGASLVSELGVSLATEKHTNGHGRAVPWMSGASSSPFA